MMFWSLLYGNKHLICISQIIYYVILLGLQIKKLAGGKFYYGWVLTFIKQRGENERIYKKKKPKFDICK